MSDNPYPLPDKPFFLQAQSGDPEIYYSADDFRRLLTALYTQPGVMTQNSFKLGQSTTVGWTVRVESGYAMVGEYLVHSQVDKDIDISGFDTNPSSLRVHRFYLAVYDKLITGTEYVAKIIAVEDLGGGAGLPPGAAATLLLGYASVNPGQTNIQNAQITDRRPHARPGSAFDNMTPNAGFLDAADDLDTGPFGFRYLNGRVYLSGAVMRTAGALFYPDNDYVVADLPLNLHPAKVKYFTCACSINGNNPETNGVGSLAVRVKVGDDGSITVRIPPTQDPKYVIFDNVQFDLDN